MNHTILLFVLLVGKPRYGIARECAQILRALVALGRKSWSRLLILCSSRILLLRRKQDCGRSGLFGREEFSDDAWWHYLSHTYRVWYFQLQTHSENASPHQASLWPWGGGGEGACREPPGAMAVEVICAHGREGLIEPPTPRETQTSGPNTLRGTRK